MAPDTFKDRAHANIDQMEPGVVFSKRFLGGRPYQYELGTADKDTMHSWVDSIDTYRDEVQWVLRTSEELSAHDARVRLALGDEPSERDVDLATLGRFLNREKTEWKMGRSLNKAAWRLWRGGEQRIENLHNPKIIDSCADIAIITQVLAKNLLGIDGEIRKKPGVSVHHYWQGVATESQPARVLDVFYGWDTDGYISSPEAYEGYTFVSTNQLGRRARVLVKKQIRNFKRRNNVQSAHAKAVHTER